MKLCTSLDASEKSAVVYKSNCKNCWAKRNIGETGKRLGIRLQEHECVIRNHEVSSKCKMRMVEVNYQLNFSEANAIAQGSSKGIQLIKFSESTSIDPWLDLHPTYRALRTLITIEIGSFQG